MWVGLLAYGLSKVGVDSKNESVGDVGFVG